MKRQITKATSQIKNPVGLNVRELNAEALDTEQLRWKDRLLFSFRRETPQDWMPAQLSGAFSELAKQAEESALN